MSEQPGEDTTEVREDEESDPALDDTTGHDWEDEGGASPEGPATATGSD